MYNIYKKYRYQKLIYLKIKMLVTYCEKFPSYYKEFIYKKTYNANNAKIIINYARHIL